MDVKFVDKNGNLLRGAAKQAVLLKLAKTNSHSLTTDEMIVLTSVMERVDRVESQLRYLPISLIFALVIGCAAGKFLKPDLVAIGIGGSAAGAILAIANRKS